MTKPTSKYTHGDCYQAAGRILLNNSHTKEFIYPILVHGTVTGTSGPNAGKQYSHAWVEIPYIDTETGDLITMVIDRSNGRDLELPSDVYYAIGRIDRAGVKEYNMEEVGRMFAKHLSYGPWEGK